MRFQSRNYHQSSTVEKFASDLSALDFIISFRKRHKTLFNVLMTVVISIAVTMLTLYLCLLFPKDFYLYLLIGFIVLIISAALIWRGSKRQKQRRSRRSAGAIKHFMKLIEQGFRVYNAYYVEGGQAMKFSVLSKNFMTVESVSRLANMSRTFDFVLKDTRAASCGHVTFKGYDLHKFDSRTGEVVSEQFCPATTVSWDEYNAALRSYRKRTRKPKTSGTRHGKRNI